MGRMVQIPSGKEVVDAYEAQPDSNCRGGIIVIHEVWGLADHVKDVAERFAKEGYFALAPELLADSIDMSGVRPLQNDLFDPEKRNATQPKLRALTAPIMNPEFGAKTEARLAALFDYLYQRPEIQNKIAVIGFCFGGTYSFSLAVREPRLKLALPFYGHSDHSVDELAKIKCPVRAFYGEKDENLMSSLPMLKDKMQKAGIDFEATVYPDCGHAFFNDTNPFAYNEAAAKDAWQKVLGHLQKYVAGAEALNSG